MLAAGALLAGGAALVAFVRPTLLFTLALAASVLSGNAGNAGLPVPLDRVLVVAALVSLALGISPRYRPAGARRLRAVEIVYVVLLVLAAASALAVGTLTDSRASFALVDQLGLVPFLGFVLADRLYGTDDDRRTLVAVMTVLGGYLAVTAVFESLGLRSLVVPAYINDPSIGTHFGRARGPFTEAGANGLALFECATAAVVGARVFRRRASRWLAGCVAGLSAFGILLTLTRSAWIAAVVGAVVGLGLDPRGRRLLVPVLVAGAVGVVAALTLVPGLQDKATARAEDQLPIWDRRNTNASAWRMAQTNPLTGVGWSRFDAENADYVRQAAEYPLSDVRIGVHNVVLSYAAELGYPGALLWLTTLGLGTAAAWRGSRALSPEWGAAAMAMLANWLVVTNFAPLAQAFPNLCVWLWLGVAAAPTARRPGRCPIEDQSPVASQPAGTQASPEGRTTSFTR